MTNPVALALSKLIVELSGRLALAGIGLNQQVSLQHQYI